MKITKLNVYLSPDGQCPSFLGTVTSLRAARHLAAKHGRGEVGALEKSLWATAAAAGHCAGIKAPTGDEDEPCAWFGRGGNYCAVRVIG